MSLSPDELKTYHDDGYLFYDRRILDENEIATVLDEIDHVISGETEFPPYLMQRESGATSESTEDKPVRKLQGLSYMLPSFEKLAKDPRIVDVIESIIGPNIKLYTDEYFSKNPAQDGKPYGPYRWHQDATNYPFFAPLDKVVTCWIALDQATPENGCMQFIPRSHGFGAIAVPQRASFLAHPVLDEPVYAPRDPGFAVFHHGLNFHGSDANQSDKPRRAIAFHYMSADTLYMGVESEDLRRIVQVGDLSNDFRFMLIRGQEFESRV